MKQECIKLKLIGITILLSTIAQAQNPLDKAAVVAKTKMVNNSKVTVCDFTSLKSNTVTVPLSMLVEEPQIVKLDDRDEALIGNASVTIYDKYILVAKSQQVPYKLFDKNGKYIASIGGFGQGPGEYQNVYDEKVDEKNGFVYLLPWMSDKLLKYDMKGKYLEGIPLGTRVMKGKFWINPSKGNFSVVQLAMPKSKAVLFTVNKSGNEINYIQPGALAIAPQNPFNNEISSGNNTKERDFMIFRFYNRVQDSLYHYDMNKNILQPVFTTYFQNDVPIHNYAELPHHFIGEVSIEKKVSENTSVDAEQRFYIVDKNTLKGSFFKLVNDYFGGIEIGWPIYSFSNGYYYTNMEPAVLKETIEKALSSGKLSNTMRTKLTKLNASISENDNNYIIYAKLK